jgi:hypothetical protein
VAAPDEAEALSVERAVIRNRPLGLRSAPVTGVEVASSGWAGVGLLALLVFLALILVVFWIRVRS